MTEAIQQLLRVFFDRTLDPLDNTTEINVSKKHIRELAEIILYTSNPIYHHELRHTTYITATQILPFALLCNKLPATLLENITCSFNKTIGDEEPIHALQLPAVLLDIVTCRSKKNIKNENTIRAAQEIILSAERNQFFWTKKKNGELQWGIEYKITTYGRSDHEPTGIEGWVPVTVQEQDIWVRVGSFDMYTGNIRDGGDQLFINLHGHRNNLVRWIRREVLLDQPTEEEVANPNQIEWIKVILCRQRTWIRYDPSVFEILRRGSDPMKYLSITLHAMISSTPLLSGFVHCNSWVNLFSCYPYSIDIPLFRENRVPVAPSDPTTRIVVTGSADAIIEVATSFESIGEESYVHEQSMLHPNYFLWSRISTDINACKFRSIVNVTDSYNISTCSMFLTILNNVSSDTPAPSDPPNVWIQYSWRDTQDSTRFHPMRYLNISKLLDVYQYFETREPDYEVYLLTLGLHSEIFRVGNPRNIISKKQSVKQPKLTLPKRIRDLCVAEFAQKKELCPITMEPLTAESMAITTCFHFFQKEAIATWLSTNDQCPQCREKTAVML